MLLQLDAVRLLRILSVKIRIPGPPAKVQEECHADPPYGGTRLVPGSRCDTGRPGAKLFQDPRVGFSAAWNRRITIEGLIKVEKKMKRLHDRSTGTARGDAFITFS